MLVRRLAVVFLLTLPPVRAEADCQGAVMLGGLHDAYHATVAETGETRALAATTLLVLVGDRPTAAFATHIGLSGIEVSTDRLDRVLTDARRLATSVISAPDATVDGIAHAPNIDWLATLYERTGCRDSPVHASQPARAFFDGAEEKPENDARRSRSGRSDAIRWILTALAAIAAFGAGAFAVRFIRNTFFFRRQLAERQPRTAISLDVEVALVTEEGHARRERIKALDVSAGGMKLGWKDPPDQGQQVTIDLPTGPVAATIIWSNAFYAGVMFNALLADETLETLTHAT